MGRNRSARYLSLPNILTASRIAASPVLAWAVLTAQSAIFAAALVLIAALTDVFDGMIARIRGSVSDLGTVLDPIADKIFVLTALLLLLGEGVLKGPNAWAVLIIVWREILILGLRAYAQLHGFRAPVSRLAKVKALAQYVSVFVLFSSRISSELSEGLAETGAGLLWGAAALTLYTGADYVWQAWRQTWK